ncbi:phosphatidylethanolamine-binding protein [Saccharomonospora piscinae]|uniref:Phosphatidylethanolamine-binding protein n=1 Tax=Saccharomonospora piscinae TaxID=687388 RepID=A0A1V9A948_SACPI|nr:YbhB/YbcL family Raf kinase inhibitor-like protein [Saccharomonospora piscinae]OQO93657.1 phosphatidylethanolamine-binding protein [Saccharomonospora piscinae]TLW94819.1 YbhB/YbcL family Raf kinase inhibitor-like protein [Saccharomonospora piscinae]
MVELELSSPAFDDGAPIPAHHARQGGNEVPPLRWSPAPEGTEELVLLCEDPDAPGGTFTHWVVTSIPPEVTRVDDAVPSGAVLGRNSFGDLGWGGPHPPVGDEAHRYVFRVSAVDRPLGLGEGATAEDVHAAADGHVLAEGTLVGSFAR